jgi:hypothetical protein
MARSANRQKYIPACGRQADNSVLITNFNQIRTVRRCEGRLASYLDPLGFISLDKVREHL